MLICQLKMDEAVFLDTQRLDEICARMGMGDAEVAICNAMEDLAALLSHAEVLRCAGDLKGLRCCAEQVAELAGRMGMPALTRVAGNACALCVRLDPCALAAVVSRMTRIGEQSLLAMWELQDLSV